MKKRYNFFIAFITTVVVSSVFIPIYIKTSYDTFYGRTNLISLIQQNKCDMCYNYNVNWLLLIIQSVVIYIFVLLILKLTTKKERKNNE